MLRMDSGSKCTWYKFIKGEQKQSLLGDVNRQKQRQFTAQLLTSTLAIIILLVLQPCCLCESDGIDKSVIWLFLLFFFFLKSSFECLHLPLCTCGETRREDTTHETSRCLLTESNLC